MYSMQQSALQSMMRFSKNLARDACASALYYIAFALALRLFHDSPTSAFCVFAYALWDVDPISQSNSKVSPRLAARASVRKPPCCRKWRGLLLQAVAELLFLLPLKIFFQPPTIYNGLVTSNQSGALHFGNLSTCYSL